MVSSENKSKTLSQELSEEIRETQSDFAAVKMELSILHENVKSLSRIVREGEGDTSIITRLALLNQKIEDIIKWRENHYETHQRIKTEISEAEIEHDKLERRVLIVEKDVAINKDKIFNEERIAKKNTEKQLELAHVNELSKNKITEERQKFLIKLLAAFFVACLTFIAGYFSK